ncbi:hypothetical protein [Nocardioides perillae]|uniref:Trypsin-like peptidase domain-containing protein n=1 Tax=Nocardioides perillae TaxID=1119534 RepID=A0A7Y9RWG9_9ACTN|nr:hypothetical protein [Nocardioides perillae]NYG55250.1 hypothetical protein [Nocardioides perillae]
MPRRAGPTLPALALAVIAAVLVALLPTGPSGAAERARRWAPAAAATITPGVQMFTAGAQCTGNFVFTDDRGRVYVGYAAHCAGLGEATDTDGCATGSLPLGTRVRFARGATLASPGETVGAGRLVYSSWRTMQRLGERRAAVCAANDFALVRVGDPHVGKVNPSVPFWGGPTGLGTTLAAGERTFSYGQSSLRPTTALSPKTGVALGATYAGWGIDAYTLTPGVPGDSGSGFLDPRGRAVGTLSTVALAPLPLSNGLGNLRRELAYAQAHAGIPGLRLVRGTEPFDPVL